MQHRHKTLLAKAAKAFCEISKLNKKKFCVIKPILFHFERNIFYEVIFAAISQQFLSKPNF